MALYGDMLSDHLTPDAEARQFVITLDQLDSDTLAGIIEREGIAGSDSEENQLATALQPVPTDEAAGSEAEPESLEPVEPEAPDEQVAEEMPAEEAETLDPVTSEPVTGEPVTSEPVQSAEDIAQILPEPESPELESLVALESEALLAIPLPESTANLSPIIPDEIIALPTVDSAADSATDSATDFGEGFAATASAEPLAALPLGNAAAPVTIAPVTIAPITSGQTSAVTIAALAPERTRPAPAPAPSAQDLAIRDLLERIRAAHADPCLIALPRKDGPDGIGLALIAARDGAMEEFSNTVLLAEDANIRQTRTLVDPRQCAVLTFIRKNRDYPATRLGIRIDQREVQSGDRLTGVLRGVAGRFTTILLIDDNGVVQDLQRFLSFSGNLVRFDVPVNRSGAARDTSQILLAIASKTAPRSILENTGRLAQDVFSNIPQDLISESGLAFATFDVR